MSDQAAISTELGSFTFPAPNPKQINKFVERARYAGAFPKLQGAKHEIAEAEKTLQNYRNKRIDFTAQLNKAKQEQLDPDDPVILNLETEIAQCNEILKIVSEITLKNAQNWLGEYQRIIADATKHLAKIGEKP